MTGIDCWARSDEQLHWMSRLLRLTGVSLLARSRRSALACGLAAAMSLAATTARADRVDELTRTASTDASWKVRLQAVVVLGRVHDDRAILTLRGALRDQNETVRAMAAQSLGELGATAALPSLTAALRDPSAMVRDKAQAALQHLQPPPAAPTAKDPSVLHVEVATTSTRANNTPPELKDRMRELINLELRRTPGLTLEGKPLSGFSIDGAITALTRKTNEHYVEVSCEISYIVGRLPSKSMVMMTSAGATAQAARATYKPTQERGMQVDALEGAVHGAHENLVTFLKSQTPAPAAATGPGASPPGPPGRSARR